MIGELPRLPASTRQIRIGHDPLGHLSPARRNLAQRSHVPDLDA
jgi:hypothetical protein